MRVISLSRTVAALAALMLAGACTDTSGPGGQLPDNPGGISIVPRNATITAGQMVAFKATLIDDHGDRLDGVGIQWTSSNDAVATVAATGDVLGRGSGHAVITASALGKSQFSTVHVLARPPKPTLDPDGKGSKKVKPNMEPANRPDR